MAATGRPAAQLRQRSATVPWTPPRAPRTALVALVLAVVSTVAFLPGGMERWVLPKLLVAAASAVLACFAPGTGRVGSVVWLVIATAVGVLLISALAGEAPIAQLLGRWPRYEGLVALSAYIAMVWAGARLLGPGVHRRTIDTFYAAASWAAIAIAALAILESIGLDLIPSDLTRPGSLLGNASDEGSVGAVLAAVLAVPLFAATTMRDDQRPRRRSLMWTGLVGAITSVVLSASRTAIIALAVLALAGVVMLAVRALRGRGSAALPLAAGTGLAASAVAVFAVPLTRDRVLGLAPNAQGLSGRSILWQSAFDVVGHRAVLGVGPSGYVDAAPAYFGRDFFAAAGAGSTADSPHNLELQALVAGGFALIGVLTVLTIIVGRHAWRGLRSDAVPSATRVLRLGCAAGLLVYGVTLQTAFTSASNALLPSLLLGALIATARVPTESPRRERVVSLTRTVGLSALVLFLLLSTIAEWPLQGALASAAAGDTSGTLANYQAARTLRPWDADIDVLEAQTLTALSSRRAPGAAAQAVFWSRHATATFPHSVLATKALIASLEFAGDERQALSVAEHLDAFAPHDPETASRIAELRTIVAQSQH